MVFITHSLKGQWEKKKTAVGKTRSVEILA